MNIAIVLWELNIHGGTQRQAIELATSLKRAGHSVDIFCYSLDANSCYPNLLKNLQIYSVEHTESRDSHVKNGFKQKIKNFLKDSIFYFYSTCHIPIPMSPKVAQLQSLLAEHSSSKQYDVINLHDYIVYTMSNYLDHKNVIWMMNDAPSLNNNDHSWYSHIQETIRSRIVRSQIEQIRTICVLDKRNVSICLKLYKRDARLVRSGIDNSLFDAYTTKYSDKEKGLLFVSSIFFKKRRTEDVVEAIRILVSQKEYSNIQLLINGNPSRDPSYYKFILSLIHKYNLESYITVRTGLSEKELLQTYSKSAIFIFPNHNQTWGLAVFEAMLAGCVCIVSKTAGAHEVLTDNANTLLVDPKSPQQIVQKIEWVLNHPKEAQNISESAKMFIKENMSWDAYAKDMLQCYSYK